MRPAWGSTVVFHTNAESGASAAGLREAASFPREPRGLAAVRGRRQELHDRVEHLVHAHVQERRDRQHGVDPAGADRGPEPLRELLLRQRALLEELLHQLFVALGHHLHELLAPGLGRVRLGGGDLRRLELAARVLGVEARLAGDEVHDALERLALADRHCDRHRGAPEGLLDPLERALERGVVAVHAVDDQQAGDARLLGVAPDLLGLHLDARDRVHHHDRGVGHAQRRARLGEEVGVAGRVDQVDLGLLPLGEGERRRTG